jgi:hypothetical protein
VIGFPEIEEGPAFDGLGLAMEVKALAVVQRGGERVS